MAENMPAIGFRPFCFEPYHLHPITPEQETQLTAMHPWRQRIVDEHGPWNPDVTPPVTRQEVYRYSPRVFPIMPDVPDHQLGSDTQVVVRPHEQFLSREHVADPRTDLIDLFLSIRGVRCPDTVVHSVHRGEHENRYLGLRDHDINQIASHHSQGPDLARRFPRRMIASARVDFNHVLESGRLYLVEEIARRILARDDLPNAEALLARLSSEGLQLEAYPLFQGFGEVYDDLKDNPPASDWNLMQWQTDLALLSIQQAGRRDRLTTPLSEEQLTTVGIHRHLAVATIESAADYLFRLPDYISLGAAIGLREVVMYATDVSQAVEKSLEESPPTEEEYAHIVGLMKVGNRLLNFYRDNPGQLNRRKMNHKSEVDRARRIQTIAAMRNEINFHGGTGGTYPQGRMPSAVRRIFIESQ